MLSLTLFHSLNKVDILYKTLPLTFACRQYQLSLYLLCTAGAYELLKACSKLWCLRNRLCTAYTHFYIWAKSMTSLRRWLAKLRLLCAIDAQLQVMVKPRSAIDTRENTSGLTSNSPVRFERRWLYDHNWGPIILISRPFIAAWLEVSLGRLRDFARMRTAFSSNSLWFSWSSRSCHSLSVLYCMHYAIICMCILMHHVALTNLRTLV